MALIIYTAICIGENYEVLMSLTESGSVCEGTKTGLRPQESIRKHLTEIGFLQK